MTREQPTYLSYLLRLWRANNQAQGEGDEAGPAWRASLESSRTRECRAFSTLEELFDFLRRETGVDPSEDERGEVRR